MKEYLYHGIIVQEFKKEVLIVQMPTGYIVTELKYKTHNGETKIPLDLSICEIHRDKNNRSFFLFREPSSSVGSLGLTDLETIKNYISSYYESMNTKLVVLYDYFETEDMLVPIFKDLNDMENTLLKFQKKIIDVTNEMDLNINKDKQHIIVKKAFDLEYYKVGEAFKITHPKMIGQNSRTAILRQANEDELVFEYIDNDYWNTLILRIDMFDDTSDGINPIIERLYSEDEINERLEKKKRILIGEPLLCRKDQMK